MRSSKSRSRNKSNRQRTLGNVVNRVFDSSGPEGKVRGTPQQIIEKYLALARDAQLSGDRVAEQAFFQHAEHYTRMLGEAQKEMAERQQFHQPRQDGEDSREVQPNGNGGNQPREHYQGNRDENRRDDNRRDENRRDDNRRDDNRRDDPRRDDNRRDDRRDDTRREPYARDQAQPRPQPVTASEPVAAPAPVAQEVPFAQPEAEPVILPEGLPDAVITSEEDSTGPVETPEAEPRPARSRAPRAPRGDKPAAPRQRRRKPAEGEAGAEEAPVASEE